MSQVRAEAQLCPGCECLSWFATHVKWPAWCQALYASCTGIVTSRQCCLACAFVTPLLGHPPLVNAAMVCMGRACELLASRGCRLDCVRLPAQSTLLGFATVVTGLHLACFCVRSVAAAAVPGHPPTRRRRLPGAAQPMLCRPMLCVTLPQLLYVHRVLSRVFRYSFCLLKCTSRNRAQS